MKLTKLSQSKSLQARLKAAPKAASGAKSSGQGKKTPAGKPGRLSTLAKMMGLARTDKKKTQAKTVAPQKGAKSAGAAKAAAKKTSAKPTAGKATAAKSAPQKAAAPAGKGAVGTPKATAKVAVAAAGQKAGKGSKAASPAVPKKQTPLVTSLRGKGAQGRSSADDVCREVACEGLSTTAGYCRLHYIRNWKKIKRKELILKEGKLNQYIEELVAKYPDKYIEAIRQDLAADKDFAKVIYDLDLDEGVDDFDVEGGESIDSVIDTIKRDFDDEGEGGF